MPLSSIQPRPELKPFQVEGVQFALSRRATLLADEMGLGKSAQAIDVINHTVPHDLKAGLQVLIVCPAYLKFNWENELKTWFRGENVSTVGSRGLLIEILSYDSPMLGGFSS